MSSLVDQGGRKFVSPAQKASKGLVIGIPSLGVVPTEFALSLGFQQMPINFGATYISPQDCQWDWEKSEVVQAQGQRGMPVADARNVIAKAAIDMGAEWLFFRDDDTIAPPESINKLYTLARDMLDRGVPLACIGGNYMSKQVPPHSLILCDGYLAGFENWEVGDVVGGEKTAIGMGCTLIPVDVLRKMEPPWFKTVDSLDPAAKSYNLLANRVIYTGNDIQDVAPGCVRMTEDVYFCRKASRYGFTQVWCDTSIQCTHIDINSGRRYFYHSGLRRGVWQDGHVIQWYLRPSERFVSGQEFVSVDDRNGTNGHAKEEPPKPEIVRYDLGQPGKKEGWITVDLYEKSADEQVDITDMRPLLGKYGYADEIRASHIWEHFEFRKCISVISHWVRCLKPGGTIHVEVPDAEWGCENLLKHKDLTPDRYWDQCYKLIGIQSNPGDFHKNLFTKSLVEYILNDPALGLEDVHVEHFSYPDVNVQRAIRATAKRKAAPRVAEGEEPKELCLEDTLCVAGV